MPLAQTSAQILHRRLLAWSDNTPLEDWLYVILCLFLTCMAGLMSGLTLGLLSLDTVDLEVLLRSGTISEQRYARKIMPLVSNTHLLLVSLLMCNAVAMEALPLFLDKLADPITAVIVSVTAVLFFGEIIPQSVCSRYGLRIGARLAPLVRLLMWLCFPVAWPISKLLDLLIGPDHHTLFRRRQLKELVSMHAEDAGMGGALTRDEIKVITGALDLTSKVAHRAMTPLHKVFMLSSSDRLDEATLRSVLRSGHSRIPVHREGDRGDVVGLVLVKELLQYRLSSSEDVPVAMLRIRSIPRLPATTRMYDMLRLFQTGRSHIAVLTQPPPGELKRLFDLDPSMGAKYASASSWRGSRARAEGPDGGGGGAAAAAARQGSSTLPGGAGAARLAAAVGRTGGAALDDTRSIITETEGDGDGGYMSYGLYYTGSGGARDTSYPPSALDPQDASEAAADMAASFRHWGMTEAARGELDSSNAAVNGGSPPGASTSPLVRMTSAFAAAPAAAVAAAAAAAPAPAGVDAAAVREAAEVAGPSPHPRGPASPPLPQGGQRLSRMGLQACTAPAAAVRGGDGSAVTPGGSWHGGSSALTALNAAECQGRYVDGEGVSGGAAAAPPRHSGGPANSVSGEAPVERMAAAGDVGDEYDSDEPEEGRPIGIITIEDVIEELIRTEIVDETDRYVDNDRLIRVNQAQLARSLPEHLAKVLAAAGASKKAATALHRAVSGNLGTGVFSPSRRSFAAGLGLGLGAGAGSVRDLSHGSGSHHHQQQPEQQSALRVPLLQADLL